MAEISITMEEYKELVRVVASVEAFSVFVRRSSYSIDREDCASFLGFKLEDDHD